MKQLIAKIRRILRDRRTRRLLTRFISTVAAIVVFITTYALVLPAITMESVAACGIEEHQHSDACYETALTCGKTESEGHHHTGDCYGKVLICEKEVHIHSTACYKNHASSAGTAKAAEESAVAASTSSIGVTADASTGIFDSASADSFSEDPAVPLSENPADPFIGENAGPSISVSGGGFTDASGNSAFTDASGDNAFIDASDHDFTDASAGASGTDPGSVNADDDSRTENKETGLKYGSENAGDGKTETAAAALTELTGTDNDADSYVPQLDPLYFDAVLNDSTGIYRHAVADGETIEDSSAVPAQEWTRIPNNSNSNENTDTVELGKNDLLRVYLAYTIPAGSLNQTNPVARYRLPGNLHLTDSQVKAVNETVNGVASQYVNYDSLEITDPDLYNAYLGVAAVEGTRIPTDAPEEYLAEPGKNGSEAVEYISATVKVENVYDMDGTYGEKGAYLGQDLIVTFTPYSIEKNRHEYDKDGQPTKAGEKIEGWLTIDLSPSQIDWSEPAVTTPDQSVGRETDERTERTADIVFVQEGKDGNGHTIHEISTTLKLVEETGAEPGPDQENQPAEEDPSNKDKDQNGKSDADDKSEEDSADKDTPDENGSGENAADKSSADEKADSAAAGPASEGTDSAAVMPAMSFNDKITVSTGKPVGLDENVGGTVANAAEALPEEAEVTVRVEADEGTFPAGTTMVLKAVDDLDAVAETVTQTVDTTNTAGSDNNENDQNSRNDEKNAAADTNTGSSSDEQKNLKTYGFQAVDITFIDAEGNEIEPAKPVRVALTSETVEQVRKDAETSAVSDPVVVHVDDDGKAEQMELVDPEEIEPAQGKTEKEIERTPDTEKTAEAESSADSSTAGSTAESSADLSTAGFTADSFSVYVIVYTVDFHYDVDGTTYDYSIKGGDTISLKELLPALNVITDDAETENVDEVQTFINDIESVRFSDESLVKVAKISEDTAVKELKEKIRNEVGLEPEYSGDLTAEQIAEMDRKMLKALDWALVSMKAFGSEETLTVSMKSGEVFEIRVTDDNTPAPAAEGNPPNAFYGEDTTKYATKINLFDYGPTNNSTNQNENLDCERNNLQNNPNSNIGINQNHALKFFSYGKKPSDINQYNTTMGINNFSGGPHAVQGIVNNTLDGLYPKLNGGASLDYLFNDWESGTTKQVYSNVTNLFQRDVNGKFFYDSNANYAYYNPAQGDNGKVVLGSTFTEEGSDWGVGFFPFDGYNDYYNCIHGDGINWCDSNGTGKVGHYNHHFGMSMNVDFMMSSDHRMSGQEMIFNFRGDDDMWVFVDDVLILDIGGVHNPVGGWINFTDQTVHVDSAIQVGSSETSNQAVDKTFAELFAAAGKTWDNSAYADHTLKVFYIERGGCYSNLQVEYNLTRYIDYEFYKKDQHGNPVPGAKFSLYKEDGTRLIKEVQVNNNGEITGTTYFEATSDADGRVYFDHVPLGKYEIREIETPSGYVKNGATYKAILEVREKEDAPGQYDAITYLEKKVGGVTTRVEPKEIINYKDVEVSLEKYWNSTNNSTPPSGAKASFTLMRNQKVLPKEVTVIFQYSDGTEISRATSLHDGDTVNIKDYKLNTQSPTAFTSDGWRRENITETALLKVNDDKEQLTLSTTTTYKPTIFQWGNNGVIGGGVAWEEDSSTSTQVGYLVNTAHADTNNTIVLKLDKNSGQFVRPPAMSIDRGTATAHDDWENVPVLSFTLPDEADEGESWKKTLENLPAADPYGYRYKYYIVENEITGISSADRFTWDYTTSAGSEANPLEEGGEIGILNIENVTAKIVKQWDHTGNNGTRPASLTVNLSNGETKELTAANNWTAEVSGLPKYDHVTGNLINYSWTEEELPAGYYLSNIQSNTNETTGVITTTLTNKFTGSYNPLTEIKGKKIWDDGGFFRPDSITVRLYKDGGSTPYRELTVQAPTTPGANQDEWPFDFTNLPIFNEDGTIIQYTVEEGLPSGYTGNYTMARNFTQATYVAGTTTGTIVNSGEGSQTLELCDGTDLGYIVIRHGSDFIVWTPRPATSAEISSIKAKVMELSEQFNGISTASGSSMRIISGVPQTVDVGKKHAASVYMNGSKVMITFLNPNAWSDFAYGTIPYTYTQVGGEGGGTITNTLKTVSVNASKTWINTSNAPMMPAEGTAVTFDVYIGETSLNRPVVLNGKTDVRALDGDPVVAQTQEVNTAALDAKAYESAPWTATWANLPEKDASGNLIQYTVRETVCPNGFENQTTAGVSAGGTITNKQTTIDISFVKTDGSGNKLEGAKFQLWVDDAAPSAPSHYVLVKSASGYATGYAGIRFNDGTGAADAELTTVYANEKTPGTGTPYESGFVTSDQTMALKNLPDGKYKLVEVDAPDGYVILANEIFFEITEGAVTSSSASDGSGSKVHLNTTGVTAVLTVDNTPGFELPSTGGPGTKLIYILGGLLTLGSLLLLHHRKRIMP